MAAARNDEALKKMAKLVNYLYDKSDAGPFREPVAWRELELWDYPKIVTYPMDLGTVKRKLERKLYPNAAYCASDIRKIWSNCMTYNAEGSDFYLLAKLFSRRFEDRYRKMKQEYDVGEMEESDEDDDNEAAGVSPDKSATPSGHSSANTPRASPVTAVNTSNLDAKAELASRLFLLNGLELAHVMQLLEQECPQALEDVIGLHDPHLSSEEPIQQEINLDVVTKPLFAELEKYTLEKVGSHAAAKAHGLAVTHVHHTSRSRASRRPHKKRKK